MRIQEIVERLELQTSSASRSPRSPAAKKAEHNFQNESEPLKISEFCAWPPKQNITGNEEAEELQDKLISALKINAEKRNGHVTQIGFNGHNGYGYSSGVSSEDAGTNLREISSLERNHSNNDSELPTGEISEDTGICEVVSDPGDQETSSITSSDDETFTILSESLSLYSDSFDNPQRGPPFPEDFRDDNILIRAFRVVNVSYNGYASLTSRAHLKSFLAMDGILQKFYNKYNDFIKCFHFTTEENLVKNGYYVVKLGDRFERCQYLCPVAPQEFSGDLDLRVRLLDCGIPTLTTIDTLRPLHSGFKILAQQGYTAEFYDPTTSLTTVTDPKANNDKLHSECQNNVYSMKIFKADVSYPECPHLTCSFME